jgi:hypothetical protein
VVLVTDAFFVTVIKAFFGFFFSVFLLCSYRGFEPKLVGLSNGKIE